MFSVILRVLEKEILIILYDGKFLFKNLGDWVLEYGRIDSRIEIL